MNKSSWGATAASLDVGTTKTCAVVVASTANGLEVIGVGEAPSSGLRKGVVTDLEETIRSIEAATERAERMAGVHISRVVVGVTGEHVRSMNHRGVVAIGGEDREVGRGDVRRVVDASRRVDVGAERQLLHALPRHYAVDGQAGVNDPLGMSASRLELQSHIVTGGSASIANLVKCVHRAGLEPAGIVFEPLASSEATLRADEREQGVVLLDIGGGTTDVAVYAGGGAVHTSTVALGGNAVTNDLAHGLQTTFAEAERVKRAAASASEERDDEPPVDVRGLDGRTLQRVPRAHLRAIVAPRLAEIFALARAQVAAGVPRDVVVAEIVVTGGGAHLHGIERAASAAFGVPARIGIPSLAGLGDAVRRPEYATAVGLLLFGSGRAVAAAETGRRARGRPLGTRLAGWFGDLWN